MGLGRKWSCALAATLALGGGCGGGDEVVVHLSLPQQGDFRPLSEDAIRGARIALERHEGRPVALRVFDDALAATGNWDAGLVSANARRAIADDRVVAYIGEANSGATAVAMPLLNDAGVLQVSPTSTYVGLTRAKGAEKGEPARYRPSGRITFGRIIPADHHQAAAMADLVKSTGVRKLHLVHDRDVYGRGLATLVGAAARKLGVKVTGTDGIDRRAANFRGLGDRIRARGADGVFFGGSVQSGATQVLRDVASANPSLKVFGPDAVAVPAFAAKLGRGLERRAFLTSPALAPDDLSREGREVLALYKQRYKREPTPFTIYGYEAMAVVLDAIDRAGEESDDRAAVVKAFFATKGRRSALGRYSIDRNGDTTLRTYGAYRVRRGELVYDRALGR